VVELGFPMNAEEEKTFLLGVVLKRIGNFDLGTFKGRLVLQKTIYLLQSYGLNLGYTFSWYIHGPYSPELAKTAFRLQKSFTQIPVTEFTEPQIEAKFSDFLGFLGEEKTNGDWLEQLACTHFLKAINPEEEKSEIIQKVLKHESHFTKKQCQEAWAYLVRNKLVMGEA
jgi:uncharacterized protein YwgA